MRVSAETESGFTGPFAERDAGGFSPYDPRLSRPGAATAALVAYHAPIVSARAMRFRSYTSREYMRSRKIRTVYGGGTLRRTCAPAHQDASW